MMLSRWLVALLTALTVYSASPIIAQPAGASALAAQSNDAGGVRLVVTPKSVSVSVWEFEVVMDTHTKPLDADLAKTAVMLDDDGRRYAPLAWQGDPPGGHHRKGVLRFAAPKEQIKSFELQIQDLGGVNKRVFQWTMK
jgi:hypothetical protein